MEAILMNMGIFVLFVLIAVVAFRFPIATVFAMGSWYMTNIGLAGYFFIPEWFIMVFLFGFVADIILWAAFK